MDERGAAAAPSAEMTGGGGGERALGVVVLGRGRLGRFAAEVIESAPDLELLGAFGSADDWSDALSELEPALAFEATVAGRGALHAERCLAAGVRPIVATSGVTAAELQELDRRARELGLGGFVVPNFSLGALLLERCARELAPHFPRAAIVETHRPEKRDAPSGTALHLADVLAAAGLNGTAIHSLRLPGHYAHHELVLAAPGEALTLRHDMHGPAAFAPGILAALRAASTARGVALGLGAAFDLGRR